MKYALIFLLTITGATCYSQEIQENFKKLEWVLGTWSQINITKAGKTTLESWSRINDHELGGRSITLQDKDTVFIEKFKVILKENVIYYVADVPENKEPVYFKLTTLNDNGFVCENPEHDFPKKITYTFDGTTLKAQISGSGKSVDFLFRKK